MTLSGGRYNYGFPNDFDFSTIFTWLLFTVFIYKIWRRRLVSVIVFVIVCFFGWFKEWFNRQWYDVKELEETIITHGSPPQWSSSCCDEGAYLPWSSGVCQWGELNLVLQLKPSCQQIFSTIVSRPESTLIRQGQKDLL